MSVLSSSKSSKISGYWVWVRAERFEMPRAEFLRLIPDREITQHLAPKLRGRGALLPPRSMQSLLPRADFKNAMLRALKGLDLSYRIQHKPLRFFLATMDVEVDDETGDLTFQKSSKLDAEWSPKEGEPLRKLYEAKRALIDSDQLLKFFYRLFQDECLAVSSDGVYYVPAATAAPLACFQKLADDCRALGFDIRVYLSEVSLAPQSETTKTVQQIVLGEMTERVDRFKEGLCEDLHKSNGMSEIVLANRVSMASDLARYVALYETEMGSEVAKLQVRLAHLSRILEKLEPHTLANGQRFLPSDQKLVRRLKAC